MLSIFLKKGASNPAHGSLELVVWYSVSHHLFRHSQWTEKGTPASQPARQQSTAGFCNPPRSTLSSSYLRHNGGQHGAQTSVDQEIAFFLWRPFLRKAIMKRREGRERRERRSGARELTNHCPISVPEMGESAHLDWSLSPLPFQTKSPPPHPSLFPPPSLSGPFLFFSSP